jgi:hypothetical protein
MLEDNPASADGSQAANDKNVTTIDLSHPGAEIHTAAPVAPLQASTPPPAGVQTAPATWDVSQSQPSVLLSPYIPEKQQDYVRLTFTIGLLLMFGWVIVWASIESASWPSHWDQTKDMLQIILPALTGLIGSVSGFYFGSRGNSKTDK